ncbi:MAG TPA: O-methyltransferase [Acholeplasmataceae bacterium]|jgi:predicted O-methyltransferase YrrM|nr:O-methyltransferase [Acholeplasmataceae bacterium]
MHEYIAELNDLPSGKVVKAMKKYAHNNKIPIINDEGLTMILMLVDIVKPKRFLEIGTAIGYCAVNVALHDPDILIDTIEKNPALHERAVEFIADAGLYSRIKAHCADALEFDMNQLAVEYEMIFIDAAKAQYIELFEKYKTKLAPGGLIFIDNLLFHGLIVSKKPIENKDLKHLAEKIDKFNHWLSRNKQFETRFFAIGDGFAVSRRIDR